MNTNTGKKSKMLWNHNGYVFFSFWKPLTEKDKWEGVLMLLHTCKGLQHPEVPRGDLVVLMLLASSNPASPETHKKKVKTHFTYIIFGNVKPSKGLVIAFPVFTGIF